MFKKTRRKIVAAVMSVLALLWIGTLGVIYTSSYIQMKAQNKQMLQAHADMYDLPREIESLLPPNRPAPGKEPEFRPGFDPASPEFQLSTFCSVAVSDQGEILEIKNGAAQVYTDDQLAQAAADIISSGRSGGTQENLTFLRTDKGGYTLVTFMDNTVINESAVTLLRYTLIFGGVAMVLFFFLSVFLARRILAPLEESYQKQQQFVSDAGHELKTPVAVISANAELLSRELGDNQWLQNIQHENERMGLLVTQLLELARTEQVTWQLERVELSRLVAGEALAFESVAFEKGLSLNSAITGGIAVEGNSAQLKQLTAILLDNAIRHSSAAGEVRLTLTREHGVAALSVVNPGDPIPEEHRERIFERFYREDPARSGQDRHYGLGLAIARAIVNAHHGQIRALCYDGLVELRVSLPAVREK